MVSVKAKWSCNRRVGGIGFAGNGIVSRLWIAGSLIELNFAPLRLSVFANEALRSDPYLNLRSQVCVLCGHRTLLHIADFKNWFQGWIDIAYWPFKQATDAHAMCACMPPVGLARVIAQATFESLCLMVCGKGVGLALGVRVRVLGLVFIAPFYREPLHFSLKCASFLKTATLFHFLPFSIENRSRSWNAHVQLVLALALHIVIIPSDLTKSQVAMQRWLQTVLTHQPPPPLVAWIRQVRNRYVEVAQTPTTFRIILDLPLACLPIAMVAWMSQVRI